MELKIYGVNNLVEEGNSRYSNAHKHGNTYRNTFDTGTMEAPDDTYRERDLRHQAGHTVTSSEEVNRDSSIDVNFEVGEIFGILANKESIDTLMSMSDKDSDIVWFILSGQIEASMSSVNTNHATFICSCRTEKSRDDLRDAINGNAHIHFSKLKTSEIKDAIQKEFMYIHTTHEKFKITESKVAYDKTIVRKADALSEIYEIGTRLLNFMKNDKVWNFYDKKEISFMQSTHISGIENITKEAANELIKIIGGIGFSDYEITNGVFTNTKPLPPIKTKEEFINRMTALSTINSYSENLYGAKLSHGGKKMVDSSTGNYVDAIETYNKKKENQKSSGINNPKVNTKNELLFFIQQRIEEAEESVRNAAAKGSVDIGEAISTVLYSICDKLDIYMAKEYESLDLLYADHIRILDMIQRKVLDDRIKDKCIKALSETTYTKAQIILYVKDTSQSATGTAVNGLLAADADMFKLKVPYKLELGVAVKIEDVSIEKDSWVKAIALASKEMFSADLSPSAQACMNRFKSVRELNARILTSFGKDVDRIVNSSGKREIGLGGKITQAIANGIIVNAGEINPKLIDLEEDIRNIGTYIRSGGIYNKGKGKEYYNYKVNRDGAMKPLTKSNESPHENPNLYNVNSSKDYSYLNMFGINEDFAPMGGFAEGTGGYGQVGERTPGNFIAPMEGDPHAPTPEDTPFDENGEKTPFSQSGSGDIFSFSKKKKENLK